MTNSTARRARVARVLIPLSLGVVLAIGAGAPAAFAEEIDHGGGQVTISVSIDEFDPCSVGAPGCAAGAGGGDDLAVTGVAIGVPLGVGVLLAAAGASAYALARRRRAVGSDGVEPRIEP